MLILVKFDLSKACESSQAHHSLGLVLTQHTRLNHKSCLGFLSRTQHPQWTCKPVVLPVKHSLDGNQNVQNQMNRSVMRG